MNEQHLWYNTNTNKHHLIKGDRDFYCNMFGKKYVSFIPYCTGVLNYKRRVRLATKLRNLDIKPIVPSLINSKTIMNNSVKSQLTTFIYDRNQTQRLFRNISHTSYTNHYKSLNKTRDNLKYLKELSSKKKLNHSTINIKYLPKLRETLNKFSNLKRCNEKTLEILNFDIKEDNSENECRKSKSYSDIKNYINTELYGVVNTDDEEDTKEITSTKGMYEIKVPTESDLHIKAKSLRRIINPKIYENECKIKKDESELLRRQRKRLLFNILMLKRK